ncbi:MAPEG family protein [Rhodovulum sp. DZ06]|uniref:MAPEG family protein n=1 Tax=Rhodovulum sp. DZ06 TaxID=3425126 RepID=UPI003D34A06B
MTEITVLALLVLVSAGYFFFYSVTANMQVGPKYAMGPRDEPRQLTGLAGRAQRALNNQFEGMILYTAAALAVTLLEASSPFTATCAWIYLGVRVVYLPLYALGATPWRSIAWGVGFFATLGMAGAAAF